MRTQYDSLTTKPNLFIAVIKGSAIVAVMAAEQTPSNNIPPELERARKAAIDARSGRKPTVSVVEKDAEPKDKPKTDAQLTRDLERAIGGVFEVVRVIVEMVFKKKIEPLSKEEREDGANAWLPAARKFTILASIALWISAPVWLFVTFKKKMATAEDIKPKTNDAPPKPAIEIARKAKGK
jgi:hypothetical protein